VGADTAAGLVVDGATVDTTPGVSMLELALLGADSAVLPESAAGWMVDAIDPTCNETGVTVTSPLDVFDSNVTVGGITSAVSMKIRRTILGEKLAAAGVESGVTLVVRDGWLSGSDMVGDSLVGAEVATPEGVVGSVSWVDDDAVADLTTAGGSGGSSTTPHVLGNDENLGWILICRDPSGTPFAPMSPVYSSFKFEFRETIVPLSSKYTTRIFPLTSLGIASLDAPLLNGNELDSIVTPSSPTIAREPPNTFPLPR